MGLTKGLKITLLAWALTAIIFPLLLDSLGYLTGLGQQVPYPLSKPETLVSKWYNGGEKAPEEYFWGRPVYTQDAFSGSTNMGPTNNELRKRTIHALQQLESPMVKKESNQTQLVPADLISEPGSGLDPHISPTAARFQAPRIAQTRGVTLEHLLSMIETLTEGRDLGMFGQPRVNVMKLNETLDRMRGGGKENNGKSSN